MDTAPARLILMQLRLERIGPNANGLLERLPGDNPDDIGRLYVYHHGCGVTALFRADVPGAIQSAIGCLPSEQLWDDSGAVAALLASDGASDDGPMPTSARYVTYILAPPHEPASDKGVTAMVIRVPGPRMNFAVEVEGAIVSACVSAREDEHSGEAWVFTEPEWRGRGLARRVTRAWGRDLRSRGLVPFYSHHDVNFASRKVAYGAGARHVFDLCVYV